MKRTKEEWMLCFKQWEGSEVGLFINKGRDICEFHEDYTEAPYEYGNRWADACKSVVGLSKGICSFYETIYKVLGHLPERRLRKIIVALPVDVYSVYTLCRAIRISEEFVVTMIDNGLITPDMKRPDVDLAFQQALQIVKEDGFEHTETDVEEAKKRNEADRRVS